MHADASVANTIRARVLSKSAGILDARLSLLPVSVLNPLMALSSEEARGHASSDHILLPTVIDGKIVGAAIDEKPPPEDLAKNRLSTAPSAEPA